MSDSEKQILAIYGMVLEVNLRLEALRVTLQESGLPLERYNETLADLRKRLGAGMQKAAMDALQDENRKLFEALFAQHEGPKQ